MKLAILCSGQGGQNPAMFDLARSDARVGGLIDRWDLPVAGDLFENRNAQALVVGAACATWEALRLQIPAPHMVAGYSVGEVAALVVAGMLPASAAIALAGERARLMDLCVDPSAPQGLAAVSGLTLETLELLLAEQGTEDKTITQPSGIHVAIINGVDQLIIGGPRAALADCRGRVERMGARMQALPVSVASHTPWMHSAVAPLTDYLQHLPLAAPNIRLLSGTSGELVTNVPVAIDNLAAQTRQPVRWSDCMDAIDEAGITVALELGPGSALSRMLVQRHPRITCRATADFRSLAAIVAWLQRMQMA